MSPDAITTTAIVLIIVTIHTWIGMHYEMKSDFLLATYSKPGDIEMVLYRLREYLARG